MNQVKCRILCCYSSVKCKLTLLFPLADSLVGSHCSWQISLNSHHVSQLRVRATRCPPRAWEVVCVTGDRGVGVHHCRGFVCGSCFYSHPDQSGSYSLPGWWHPAVSANSQEQTSQVCPGAAWLVFLGCSAVLLVHFIVVSAPSRQGRLLFRLSKYRNPGSSASGPSPLSEVQAL